MAACGADAAVLLGDREWIRRISVRLVEADRAMAPAPPGLALT